MGNRHVLSAETGRTPDHLWDCKHEFFWASEDFQKALVLELIQIDLGGGGVNYWTGRCDGTCSVSRTAPSG